MREASTNAASRREFLQTTGRTAAAAALVAGTAIPRVHAAEDNAIRIALIGCGGRGTGAAQNALSVQNGPVKLVAMADVFERKLDSSYKNLQRSGDKFDVPQDHKFLGFDVSSQTLAAPATISGTAGPRESSTAQTRRTDVATVSHRRRAENRRGRGR